MSVITETKLVVADLFVNGQKFPMLEMFPSNHPNVTLSLRDFVFEFLVIKADGFAMSILVSRNSAFVIVPKHLPFSVEVKYYVEDGKEEEKDIATIVRESVEAMNSLQS